ncbi:general odorant-binding protein 56d-like [Belonocnema kinseyi]|uniref:general odorant-binding protein 56d-like n=1 Tax=Belonocnema kinseyi TaxID=2817044 RepID=UPI00143D1C46|nr:general odorant-binding protein 56d-like [Belonocnema kinseyi]
MYRRIFVLLIVPVLFILKKAECGMSQDQVDNMAKGMRKSCTSKVPVDLALVEGVVRGEFPDDPNLKCYLRCVMKMTKGIKNGKLEPNMLIAQMSLLPANGDRLIEGVKKCSSEVAADDECELSFRYVKCQYEFDPSVFFFP